MPDLTDIKGVSDSRAENLREEDFVNVDDVATADEDELTEVTGVGGSTAGDLIESAQDVIRESTLGSDDEEEDDEEFPDVEEESEPSGDVTEEDIADLLEDDGGEPDDEPTVEDDEGEPEEVDVSPDKYELTITLEDEDAYDYFFHALIEMRVGEIRATYQQEQVANDLIESIRPLAGSGEVTHTLTQSDLNSLNAVLTQAQREYKSYGTEAYTSIRAIRDQVQEVREEFL